MNEPALEAAAREPSLLPQAGELAELRPPSPEPLTPEQLAELQDAARQAEYQRQFQIQQARRACPGCGDW